MIDGLLALILFGVLFFDPVNCLATHPLVRWTRWASAISALAYAADRGGEHEVVSALLIVCFTATVLANRWAAKRLQEHYDPNGRRSRS